MRFLATLTSRASVPPAGAEDSGIGKYRGLAFPGIRFGRQGRRCCADTDPNFQDLCAKTRRPLSAVASKVDLARVNLSALPKAEKYSTL